MPPMGFYIGILHSRFLTKMRSLQAAFLSLIILVALFASFAPDAVFALEVPQLRNLPGFQNISSSTQLGDLARSFYQFALAISALLAFGMIIWGGMLWLLSAARPAMQLEAKKKITGAVTGVALLLGIFLILNTVNPQLTVLRDIAEQTAVTICENANFGGDCKQVFKSSKCTSDENCWRDPALGFNQINSLKNPQNIHVSLYKNPDFQNLCAEAYKEQSNLPSLSNDTANAQYYACGSDPIKSAKLKKEGVIMVYESINFSGQHRALKNDIANTNDFALDLNPAVPGNQKFWASPLVFNSIEIPAGFRVSLYSNTGMRDRCAVLVRSQSNLTADINHSDQFLNGAKDEYYDKRECEKEGGIKSIRVAQGTTTQPGVITLFDKSAYDGVSREIFSDSPLVNMKALSLRINTEKACGLDPSCEVYAILFDRPDFFGKCGVYNKNQPNVNVNVASLMVVRAAKSGGVITDAIRLFDLVNLNESDPSKPDWPKNHSATTDAVHVEKGGGGAPWHDKAESVLLDADVRALLFEDEHNSGSAILNDFNALSNDGKSCEGVLRREKDVLRLRGKTDGFYLFRLK